MGKASDLDTYEATRIAPGPTAGAPTPTLRRVAAATALLNAEATQRHGATERRTLATGASLQPVLGYDGPSSRSRIERGAWASGVVAERRP